jgi:hypothetical protein
MYREAILEVESKPSGSNLLDKTKLDKEASIASISEGNPSISFNNSNISLLVKSAPLSEVISSLATGAPFYDVAKVGVYPTNGIPPPP